MTEQGIKKTAGRVVVRNDKIKLPPAPLTIIGTGATFPFTIVNSSSSNIGSTSLALVFETAQPVIVDYGNNIRVTKIAKITPSGRYVVYITSNTYYASDESAIAPYSYPDGLDIEREIKIIYPKSTLYSIGQSSTMGIPSQDLNFQFYQHTGLNAFNISAPFIRSLNLNSISPNTNPNLKSLTNVFWSNDSDYTIIIPEEFLQLKLESLNVGNINWADLTDIEDTNLHLLAVRPIANTLKSIIISYSNHITIPLPANLKDLPLLTSFTISQSYHTVVPIAITELPYLTSLSINTSSIMTQWSGDLACIATLENLSFLYNGEAYLLGLPPNITDAVNLNYINYSNASTEVESKCTVLITQSYNLVVNNSPIVGTNADGFRGLVLNFQRNGGTTAITGTITAPAGYVQGSSNGTVNTTGEMIYVLQNQYNCTIYITV